MSGQALPELLLRGHGLMAAEAASGLLKRAPWSPVGNDAAVGSVPSKICLAYVRRQVVLASRTARSARHRTCAGWCGQTIGPRIRAIHCRPGDQSTANLRLEMLATNDAASSSSLTSPQTRPQSAPRPHVPSNVPSADQAAWTRLSVRPAQLSYPLGNGKAWLRAPIDPMTPKQPQQQSRREALGT